MMKMCCLLAPSSGISFHLSNIRRNMAYQHLFNISLHLIMRCLWHWPQIYPQAWEATHHNAVQCELPGQHLGTERRGLYTSVGYHGLRLAAGGDSARRHCHHRSVHWQVSGIWSQKQVMVQIFVLHILSGRVGNSECQSILKCILTSCFKVIVLFFKM